MKGVAVVQHLKHEKVKAEIDSIVAWMVKLSEEIKSKPPSVSSITLVSSYKSSYFLHLLVL